MTSWEQQVEDAVSFLAQPPPERPKFWRSPTGRGVTTTVDFRWLDWEGPDEVTVVEAAHAYGVQPATVRQWVKRGFITPIRTEGRRLILDARAVNEAFHRRSARASAAEVAARGIADPVYRGPIPCRHVTSQQMDQVMSLSRVADVTRLPPSTVRSWYRRGHLKPAGFEGKTVLVRVGDVVALARTPREKRPKARRSRP